MSIVPKFLNNALKCSTHRFSQIQIIKFLHMFEKGIRKLLGGGVIEGEVIKLEVIEGGV